MTFVPRTLAPCLLVLALDLSLMTSPAQAQSLAAPALPSASAPSAPVQGSPIPTAATGSFDLDTPIAAIAADPAGKAILDKDLPGLTSHPFYAAFKGKSLKALQPMAGGLIDDAALARTQADLAGLASPAKSN